MKELLLKIISASNIESKEISYKDFEIYFSTFEQEKMDFYLFLFINYDDLIKTSENIDDIEYTLNRIAIEIQNDYLQEYKEKYIDKNLSLITILNHDDNSQILKLKKIEENYFVTKKYLLLYNDSDFSTLNNKINQLDDINIIDSLNKLAIENGDLLNKSEGNNWYTLLMRLFIKLPFLNYRVMDEDKQSLENLSESILSSLDDSQKQIFQKLDEHFFEIRENDIEDFILDNNLLNNPTEDEL